MNLLTFWSGRSFFYKSFCILLTFCSLSVGCYIYLITPQYDIHPHDEKPIKDEVFSSAPIHPLGGIENGTLDKALSGSGDEKTSDVQNVFKIESYYKNDDGSYSYYAYGSAILIGKNQILTNAHVILGEDDLPTGRYNLCISKDGSEKPICRTSLRLMRYDALKDIALLEPEETIDLGKPLKIIDRKLSLGESIRVYGYPANGGETLSLTEGKMSGSEKGYYKIDANIDHGNSGGGAFDKDNIFVGMPYIAETGLTTMGYIIPTKMIQDFLNNIGDITEYDQSDLTFKIYAREINNKVINQKVDNPFFSFSGFTDAGFTLESISGEPRNGHEKYRFVSKSENTVIKIKVPLYQGNSYFAFSGENINVGKEFKKSELNYNIVEDNRILDQKLSFIGLRKSNGTIDINNAVYVYEISGIDYVITTKANKSEAKDVENAIKLFKNNFSVKKPNSPEKGVKVNLYGAAFKIPENSYALKSCSIRCEYDIIINPNNKIEVSLTDISTKDLESVSIESFAKKIQSKINTDTSNEPVSLEVRKTKKGVAYIYGKSEEENGSTNITILFYGKNTEYTAIQYRLSISIKSGDSLTEDGFNSIVDTIILNFRNPFAIYKNKTTDNTLTGSQLEGIQSIEGSTSTNSGKLLNNQEK